MLNAEIAAVTRFILDNCGEAKVYYNTVPEGFETPSVYFTTTKIMSRRDTLSTYALECSFEAHIFGNDELSTEAAAIKVLTLIVSANCAIPLFNASGDKTGQIVRLSEPVLMLENKNGQRGPSKSVLLIKWMSRGPLGQENVYKIKEASTSYTIPVRL